MRTAAALSSLQHRPTSARARRRVAEPPRPAATGPTALGQGHSRQGYGPSHRHTVGNTRLGLYLGLDVSRF